MRLRRVANEQNDDERFASPDLEKNGVWASCLLNPRHKRFGEDGLNLKLETVTAKERAKTKCVPNPLDAVVIWRRLL